MRNNIQVLILSFCDILVSYISLIIVVWVRYGSTNFVYFMNLHLLPFSILFIVWLIAFAVFNLHEINTHPRMLSVALIACFLTGSLFFYSFPFFSIAPKTNLALLTLLFGFFAALNRILIFHIYIHTGKKRIIIVSGINNLAERILSSTFQESGVEYRVGAVYLPDAEASPALLQSRIPVLKTLSSLIDFTRRTRVQAFVYTDLDKDKLYTAYYKLIPHGVRFYHGANFWEEFKETVPIYETDPAWYIQNLPSLQSRIIYTAKRSFDILLALLLLPVMFLVFIILAPFIRGVRGDPVFFTQTRVGKNEKLFHIVKFRTMTTDAEKDGPQWAQKNDPRVTRLGRFMRKTRIDELPQILNVLRGNMSFIGPRPERLEFVTKLAKTIPHYHLRHLVRPGITGWAQVKFKYGASSEDAAIKLMYDLYYVKNQSLVLEARILFKTITTVFTSQGH